MDTIIHRCDSNIFRDDELDVICDVAENVFFRDYFCYDDAAIFMFTDDRKLSAPRQIFLWKNHLKDESKSFTLGYAVTFYKEMRERLLNYPIPQFVAHLGETDSPGYYVDVMILKLVVGYVFCFISPSSIEALSAVHADMFGLMQATCRVLAPRDKAARWYAPILPHFQLEGTNEEIRDDVSSILDDYFNTDSMILRKWKESHR